MSVLEEIRAKAKALHRTVILPEGNEERTLKAAELSVDPIYFATCMLETGTSGSRSLSDIFIAAHNDPTNSAQEFGHQGDMPVQ
jgi:hypothetical protein